MNKIKICHVVCGLVNGGVESVIYNYFSNMDLSNYEVHIITYGKSLEDCKEKFIKLNFKIHEITPKRTNLVKSIIEMFLIIKANHYDIIHVHTDSFKILPLFLAKVFNVRIRIAHAHNTGLDENQTVIQKIKNILDGISKQLLSGFATHFFACSNEAANFMFPKKIIDSGKVTIIKNGIDANQFIFNEEVRDIYRKQLGIENKFVVGHIGRFSGQKNHSFLIDIFAEIYKKDNNAVLLLIGKGELEEDIKTKVNDLGLLDSVIFYGTTNEIPQMLWAMDAFVFPSIFEGLGMVAIEAQAAGLVTICADTVPVEAKITDILKYMSLKQSALEWCNEIIQYKYGYNRTNTYNKIVKAGYDIKTSVNVLNDFYINEHNS